jgi:hypothetical protein
VAAAGPAALRGSSLFFLSSSSRRLQFDTTIIHQQLSLELQGVSQGEDGLVVRVDSKAFKSVGKILDFLPTVQVFAKQAAANKNFVDQTLSETEVAQELQFKDYVVYPNMGTIVIHRKTKADEEDCLVARVGIEWEKCTLYSAIQNVMSDIADFNEFLLKFLRVTTVDRYEIMGALGYNPNDLDIAANRQSGRKLRASPERPAFKTTARSETNRSPRLTDADYNEKTKLMAQLRYHYSQKDGLIPEVRRFYDSLVVLMFSLASRDAAACYQSRHSSDSARKRRRQDGVGGRGNFRGLDEGGVHARRAAERAQGAGENLQAAAVLESRGVLDFE